MSRCSALLAGLVVVVLSPLAFSQCTFTHIKIAGGINPHGEGVNKYDTVVGSYTDSVTQQSRGFRWSGGHSTTHNYPGAIATSFHANNDLGAIVGEYVDSKNQTHGLEFFQGQWYAIDYPGAQSTSARGINNTGTIVGSFIKPGETNSHGFIKSTAGWKQVDFPQAQWTAVTGINVFGDIVGNYHIAIPGTHTFMLYTGGTSTFIDFPGAVSSIGTGINRWHTVVGYYLLDDSPPLDMIPVAFARQVNNTYYAFGLPYPVVATAYAGVNNLGDKTGWANNDGGVGNFAFLKVCPGA
ncbi:MAG TPA: hypothetical protein VGL89_14255 [Candidatus Koribacter sp.]|jgi:hypothetical protein